MRDTSGDLTQGGELLSLNEAVLRSAELLERAAELARPRLHLLKEPHVFDRDGSLVGKRRDELDLLLGEGARLRAREREHADRHALAQHGNSKDRSEGAEPLRLRP